MQGKTQINTTKFILYFLYLQNKLIEKIGKIYKTDTFYILDNCSHVWKSTSKYNSVYLNKYSIGLIPTSK